MDETLKALGGLILSALPTFFLVLLLHFYLKVVFFKPLEKILDERRVATEGARRIAESSLATAAEKAAQYEAAIKAARSELYQEQEQLRRQAQEEKSATVRQARSRADAAVAEAKASLASEVETLKKQLDAESEALAEQIATAVLGRRAA